MRFSALRLQPSRAAAVKRQIGTPPKPGKRTKSGVSFLSSGLVERALAFLKPADAARRAALGVVGPRARSWLVDREKRVALTIASAVVFSFVLSITSPLALLALGPILLGVPHL